MATKKAAAQQKLNKAAAGTKGTTVLKPQSQALATTNKLNQLATKQEQSMEELLLAAAGLGTEGIGAKDMAIPRINILQSNSPQCTKGDPKFLKGAEAGDFYDNITNSVFAKGDEGFLFIPVSYRRAHLEWKLRTAGGGFVADHGPDDAIMQRTTKDENTGRQMLTKDSEVVPTGEYYIIALNLNGGEPRQAVVSMAKTQLKKATRMNAALKLQTMQVAGRTLPAPSFYNVFKATSVPESNDKGNWMGWNITRYGNTPDLPEGSELFKTGMAFHGAVTAGTVKVADHNVDAPADDAPQSNEDTL